MIDITCTIRAAHPTLLGRGGRIPFGDIARAILGESYELSLVVCGDDLARRMYKVYRQPSLKLRPASKKTYSPNVLSFPLSKIEGEIFLNIRKAAREAKQFDTTLTRRLSYLFVHGCFHLKGLDHSDAMEKSEERIMQRFNLV